MSDRIKWIEYKGAKILYADYSNLEEDEYVTEIDNFEKELIKNKPNSVLVITNTNNTYITSKINKRFKEMREKTKGISKASAVVGVTGVKKIIANAIRKDLYLARSIEDAKEWLIKQI